MKTPLLLFLLSCIALGDDRMLQVRPKTGAPVLQPKTVAKPEPITDEEREVVRAAQEHGHTTLQLAIVTPLGDEVFPDRRFRSWGDILSFSLPLFSLSSQSRLLAEIGAGVTFIKITLPQPSTTFTHMSVLFPVRAKFEFDLTRNISLEVFGGCMLRPWYHDSRETTDGGFHAQKTQWLTPDFGGGLSYAITDDYYARAQIGFAHFSVGFGMFL